MKPCLCATARQASRALTHLYEAEMRECGVHPAQFELLTCLQQTGEASQIMLARMVGADQTTLSRNLKVLIRDGLIRAYTDDTDRRHVLYGLTPKGRELLRAATVAWNRAQKKIERALGADLAQTWEALARLIQVAGTTS